MGDGHQERILRAKHMRRTGRPDQARAELGLVLKDEPDHVGALHCLARLDREAGAWEAVLKNTGRILERHPAAVEARSWNAEALLSLGQAGRAESSLRKGLAASPRSGVLGLALARLLAASGRRPQALELLRELIKRGPDGEVDALHALLQELEQPPR
jgi:predicted Zn-dependent protease